MGYVWNYLKLLIKEVLKRTYGMYKFRLKRNQGGRSCATARLPVAASAGALALAGSPSIRAFVAKSVLTRITR